MNSRRSKSKFPPGSLVYFSGAMHEVMKDGSTRVRNDLKPNTPKRLWKPKWN